MAMKVESSSMEMMDATNQEKDQFTPSSTTKSIPKKLVPQIEAAWPTVKSALESSGISCILNVGAQSSMTVSTTRNYTGKLVKFHSASVLIILLSKGAPIDSAIKVLEVGSKGGMRLEVIKLSAELGGLCAQYGISKEVYSKRSKELVSGGTLEELRRLAGCGLIFHRAGLIVATGSVQGLKLVDRIVKDCIVGGVPPGPRLRKLRKEKIIDDLAGLKF